jgi:lactoylglutathione lyase
MKFGYAIVYVDDVPTVLDFYCRAFGTKTRFIHESELYGELETGETTLAFAAHELGAMSMPEGYVRVSAGSRPLGFELAFVTDDVQGAFDKAVEAGAVALSEPQVKPWGQTVAYVRSIEGSVIELCSPVGA